MLNLKKTVLSLFFLFFTLLANAADFIVTNTNDSGSGSLRQAMLDVNAAGAGPHTIKFVVYGQITLLSSLPQITQTVSIDGENKITINSNGTNQIINPFDISADNVVVKNFALTNSGDINFFVRANTTGVLIENIRTSSSTGNLLNALVNVAGSSTNLTIRNIWSSDVEPVSGSYNGRAFNFSGGTHTNLVMDNIHLTTQNNTRGGEAIVFRDASVNGWTFTNSSISGFLNGIVLDNTGGVIETANNIELNNISIDSMYSGVALGFYSDFVNTDIRIRNSFIDLNVLATADEGDYAIRFDNTTNGVTLENVTLKDVDIYSIWFNGAAENITIDQCNISHPTPGAAVGGQFVRFESTAKTVSITNSVFDGDRLTVTRDSDIGLAFIGATTDITLENNQFNEFDIDGVYAVAASTNFLVNNCKFTNNVDGIEFYYNMPRTNVDIVNSSFKNGTRSGIVINAANAVSDIDITGDTIIGNANHGIWLYGGAGVTDIQVTGSVVRDNGGAGINNEAPNKVVISDNSIYNNGAAGISLPGGNCSYTSAAGRTPVLASSTSLGAGQYQLQLTIPDISVGAQYTVDIYANDAGTSSKSGQYFVTSISGLSAGATTQTINYNTGPGATGVGFWTATLRIPANNCGTSEFGNSIPLGTKAPACINNGILAWYRADMGVNGTKWGDVSGNGNNMTVVGDPDDTTGLVNFNKAFYYDGNDAHNVPAGAAVTTTYTIMGLGKLEGSQNGRVFSSYTGNKLIGWYANGENGLHIESWQRNTSAITNHTKLYSLKRASAGSGAYEFKGNGILLSSGAASNGTAWSLDVGGSTFSNFSKVFVPEVFIYNRDLTPAEIQRLESYMALKYGITLNGGLTDYVASDGTTLMWTASANTGYQYRITGIGKDDCTMLHQKQSLSADTGIVTIALGNTVMISNPANTNTVTADKTFLFFADNNASIKLATAVTGTNVNQRMARVWKVQKSAGWADQNITLKVKGSGSNNYLLISSDPAFGAISQELALDANGEVTLNSSQLPDGSYFTIASTIKGPGNVSAGIALWLRADDGSANGNAWNDASGNGNGAGQTIAERQASVLPSVINFNPALKFDGSNDNLISPSLFTGPGVNNVQIYAVSITDGIQNQALFGEMVSNGQPVLAHVPWGDGIVYFDAPYGYRVQAPWGGTVNTPYLWSFLRSPSGMSSNRNRVTVASHVGPLNSIAGNNSQFYAGSHPGGGFFNGKIAELIVYNNSATTSNTQRQQIESYLALKYGITLTPGTPVDYLASDGSKFWDATLNNGYNFNITGIGRDNGSTLLQKQSVSTGDKYLTLALGNAIAVSNASNAGNIATDLSFFVTGNTSGAKQYTVNVTGIPGVNVAMARTWKVQKTNWTDQDITFSTDSAATAPRYLLVSTDASFGAGDLALPMTGRTITLNTSLLPNNAYFTFANELKGPGGVVNGIGAWYRGDYGLSGVKWDDYSGRGINLPAPGIPNRPGVSANGMNFNPTATFTPGQYFGLGNTIDPSISVLGNGNMNNIAIFGVSSIPVANNGALFNQMTTNGYAVIASPHNAGNAQWDAPWGWRQTAPWGGSLNKANVWSFVKSVDHMSFYRDRNTLASDNTHRNFGVNNGGNYSTNIGVYHGVDYFTGNIPELIIYKDITNAGMPVADRIRIESYLALKYGVTLNLTGVTGYTASDATVYWNAATNGVYNKHITGIGRDDLSELNQKQSVSVDTGLVTIALGNAVATSNAANTATITNDKSFFLISDNGASGKFLTAITGQSGLTNRMTRIFKVDKTANWDDQSVTFKLRGGNAGTYLIVSADEVFDAADTRYVMNADSTVTLNTSDLADGVYFTFAKDIKGPNGVNKGLNFWLRADDGQTSGSSWKDYSGYGHEAMQGVTTAQPATDAKAINFNYGLKFDGTDDFLDITTTRVHPDSSTIFVAGSGGGFSTVRDLIGSGAVGSAVGMEFRMAGGAMNYLENNAAVQGASGTSIFVENRPYLFTATQNNLANGVKLYQNFKLDGQGSISLSPSTAADLVSIGSRTIASRAFFWQGNISEVIVYDRVVSDAERQSVESYLALKYGITLHQTPGASYLASNGITYWDHTTNGIYNKRITGIGRDDSTALNTKQSLSVDTGFVTLALGSSIAVTNESNTNTITNDRSFFVFGDNGLSAANFTVTISGSANVTRRMARVWKVQKTNWTDQDITLKVKPLGVDNYLLISTDENFATIDQEVPVAADGTVTLSSSLFADGIYFTFGAPLKSPGGVSGHSIWLRADVGSSSTVNNTLVSDWNDISAYSNILKQANTALQPTWLNNSAANINFNPVMKFGGVGYTMAGESILKTGTYTAAAAFAVNSQATALNAILFNETTAGAGTSFNLHATWGDNVVYWDPPYPASRLTYNAGNINGQVNIWTGLSDNSLAANKQEILKNGASVATGNVNTPYTGSNNPFNIATNFNGRFPELIIYNTALTTGEVQRVNTYLAIKYGLTLNSGNTSYIATDGTTTVWDAAANATHKNNIAGIGRDDEEILNQKQSRSINAGLQVAIGLGNIDSTNSANTNIFSNDKSYLVWGDDNAAVNFRTAVSGTALVNYRMARVWKVQETGTIGDVQVAIPASALANPGAAYIIVSNDAVFDGTDVLIKLDPVTIENKVHYAATVDLSSGQYFTFANDLKIPGGVAGNTLWLRADYGTSSTVDGAGISDWNDFGADINNAVQATTANQPGFANNSVSNVNFNPVVKFDGASQRMILDGTKLPLGTSARTVIAATGNAATAGRGLLSWGDQAAAGTGTRYTMEIGGNQRSLEISNSRYGNTATNTLVPGITVFTNAAGTTNAATQMRWNGAGITSSLIAVGNQPLNTASQPTAYIGDNVLNGGGLFYNGSLGDIVVYDRTLTPTEQQQVETYMSIKYGVSLSQTVATDYLATDASVIWNATVNSVYKNSITGIGRDDLEGLEQKQSRNSDSSRLRVAIALGAFSENNTSNTNSFTADKSYLIWGDDNGAATFKTSITGMPDVNYRMTRIWKVQESGTVGEVEVAIPFDALPNPRESYLVVSNDDVFDNTDTYIPLYDITINGKKHWAAKADLNDGQYFTIAAFIKSPGGVGATSLWMRADQGIQNNTDGTPVDLWVDYGNEVNNANQVTAGLQPLFNNNVTDNINYNPVVSFDGTADFMNLDVTKLPTGTTARTVIGVGKPSVAPTTTRYIISWGSNGQNLGSGLAAAGAQAGYFVGWNNDLITAPNFWLPNVTNEMFGTWAGAGGQANLYSKMLPVATPANKAWTTGTTGARIGNSVWGAEYWSGPVTEVIMFDRVLTDVERQRVSTYLAIRNGYTMDQTTPYRNYLSTAGTVVWDGAANATHNQNIAGIGRDDIEGLNQKQAKSIQAGSILAIGLGNIASDNPANTSTFTNDAAYMIWGSNSTALTTTNTDLPALFSQRLTQEWKTSITNFNNQIQSVSMEFDLTGITHNGNDVADFTLLIDTDGDGDFTTGTITQIPANTYAGNTVSFANVTSLSHNAVFTLAVGPQSLRLNAKAILQGAWNGSSMNTGLKTAAVLPDTDPYGLNTTPSVSPNDAVAQVVDWVRVELRDAANPATVVEERAGFLLSNGDIVDSSYTTPLSFFNAPSANYYVAIRHRNHLGIMSASPVDFSSGTGTIDFTQASTATYGTHARKDLGGGVMALWAGNVNADQTIRHSAAPSDVTPVANAVLNHAGNTTQSPAYTGYVSVYSLLDVNLDGNIFYTATPSDHAIIISNVKTHPGNTFGITSYIIREQLP
ncbi:right-handed parallel beta-helix repeat-containing protein [Pseudoflavitalea rhizosphaerae]|uniref:right-handed parallel beta-helix repeat-containing protein n=1 Tax=Pseudoflavitalea rhizosphaerae TaxID=1884793 RepID=UPI0013DFDA15|nr:right-handed parallel beta-helix repeat-containing protein [Pseudoflavitalea rhizosphaerae]